MGWGRVGDGVGTRVVQVSLEEHASNVFGAIPAFPNHHLFDRECGNHQLHPDSYTILCGVRHGHLGGVSN